MKKKIFIAFISIFILVLIIFLLFNPFRAAQSSEPTYIFLITLDTTRADHVDYSLSKNTLTPNLAKLAGEGIIFSNAYSLIPITLPSHASIFYSLPPHILRVYNNKQINKTSHPSVAQLFKESGYQTGAVISLGVLNTHFGLSNGFDKYIENFRPDVWYKTAEEVNRDAFKMIKEMYDKKAFFWIHYSDPHAPYFPPYYKGDFSVYFNNHKIYSVNSIDQALIKLELDIKPGKNVLNMRTTYPQSLIDKQEVRIKGISFMNYSLSTEASKDNIEIYLPRNWREIRPRNKRHYLSRRKKSEMVFINKTEQNIKITIQFNYKLSLHFSASRKLYQQEIQYMDKHFGQLIKFLKKNHLFQESVFIVMGDHGEGLGEHRRCVGHIHYLNKLYLQVPLFIAGKGVIEKGVIKKNLVSNLNIAPTLLDIIDKEKPDFMQGTSLFETHQSNHLLLETYSPEAYSDGFSIIKYPYQFIYYPQTEEQKFEFIDLEKDQLGINNLYHQKINQKIKAELLNSVIKVSKAITKIKGKPDKISPEQLEILKSLGYL